jgi:predicted N-acetyltransferase YhbS
MIRLVPEMPCHIAAREALLDASFGSARFAKVSERLREGRLAAPGLSFAALDGRTLVGTVRLWHVSAGPLHPALLIGPLAVDEARRSQGLGARLMTQAIGEAAALGHRALLLVGDAPYYERFGFSSEHTGGLYLPGPYERDRFLGLELVRGALTGAAGLVEPTGEIELEEAVRKAA